jgi:glycosyltransferase involved in cell wall biosynthesis
LRIIHAVPTSPSDEKAGGVERFVRNLLPALASKETAPVLLGVEKSGGTGDAGKQVYKFIPLFRTGKKSGFALRFYTSLFFKSKRLIKEGDIIHAHRLEPLLFLLLHRNQKVITLHVNVAQDMKRRKGCIIGKLYSMFESIVFSMPDLFGIEKIVFVSDKLREEYLTEYPNIEKNSITIRTGIGNELRQANEEEMLRIKQKYDIADGDLIVLSLGRLTEQKNISFLLESFATVENGITNARLLIGGSGPDSEKLKNRAKQLGLQKYDFLGRIPDDELAGLYGIAHVFAITSTYEGGPITVYEALSCGCPVVSTNVGVSPEVVKDGKTGFIVDSHSTEKFSSSLIAVLRDYKRFQKNIMDSGYDFSIDTIAARYSELYMEIGKSREG